MKTTAISLLSLAAILLLSSCVPADQTTAVLNQQTRVASAQLRTERDRTGQLQQERKSLEYQLSAKRSRIRSLQAADPVSNEGEIQRLSREVASLERHLAQAL